MGHYRTRERADRVARNDSLSLSLDETAIRPSDIRWELHEGAILVIRRRRSSSKSPSGRGKRRDSTRATLQKS